ncbi:MAG: hypothetical protein HZC37_16990 [Burkholderiales bacterium]|nr:hypothetical protein [Burkholderiales bacterium]
MTKSFLALFTFLSAAVLAGCAGQIRGNHSGADAGRVIVGLGAAEGTNFHAVTMYYRRIDPNAAPGDRRPVGSFTSYHGLTLMRATQARDYANDKDSGVVLVQSIPAGDYEMHSFKVDIGGGNYTPTAAFSVRFTVRPGEAVYLGNYQTYSAQWTDIHGRTVTGGPRFAVSNRLDSELALARAKAKDIPATVTNGMPDLRSLRGPLFIAAAAPAGSR